MAQTSDPAEKVTISHPGLPGTGSAVTTREAFDSLWQAKGWQVVDDAPAAPAAAPVTNSTTSSGPSGRAAATGEGAQS